MAEFTVVERAGRDLLGEGPHWSVAQQALYWVDIVGKAVHRYDPAAGGVRTWETPNKACWVLERRDGGFMAGLADGFYRLAFEPFGLEPVGDPEPDRPQNRLNDAKVDQAGRIWAGSKDDSDQQASGALWRLDPDLSWTLQDDGYEVANGPTFSPDGRTLYHTDSGRRVIYRFDLAADGTVSNRRPFVTFPDDWGHPDGMTTDAEGCLWAAHWGGGRVSRFDPDGKLMRHIALPASQITSCAFAGPDLDVLFVTSASQGKENEPLAGALFRLEPGVTGLPANLFAG